LSLLMRLFVGYGYYPWRALGGLTILTILAWIINRRTFLAGAMVPTEAEAYKSYKEKGSPTPNYARFSSLIYSLENSLPLVKLGQAERWQSDPNPQSAVRRSRKWMDHLRHLHAPWLFLHPFFCLRTIFRWILKWAVRASHVVPRTSRYRGPLLWIRFPLRRLIQWTARLSLLTTSPKLQRRFLWAQILVGWILATLFAAAITGIIRK